MVTFYVYKYGSVDGDESFTVVASDKKHAVNCMEDHFKSFGEVFIEDDYEFTIVEFGTVMIN